MRYMPQEDKHYTARQLIVTCLNCWQMDSVIQNALKASRRQSLYSQAAYVTCFNVWQMDSVIQNALQASRRQTLYSQAADCNMLKLLTDGFCCTECVTCLKKTNTIQSGSGLSHALIVDRWILLYRMRYRPQEDKHYTARQLIVTCLNCWQMDSVIQNALQASRRQTLYNQAADCNMLKLLTDGFCCTECVTGLKKTNTIQPGSWL